MAFCFCLHREFWDREHRVSQRVIACHTLQLSDVVSLRNIRSVTPVVLSRHICLLQLLGHI
jgi:hypothetical protein